MVVGLLKIEGKMKERGLRDGCLLTITAEAFKKFIRRESLRPGENCSELPVPRDEYAYPRTSTATYVDTL